MKKAITLFTFIAIATTAKAQYNQNGTPDMRYNSNKNTYSTPSYTTPSRNYSNGGEVRVQDGYTKQNGTYVAPHLKTRPDDHTYNNLGR